MISKNGGAFQNAKKVNLALKKLPLKNGRAFEKVKKHGLTQQTNTKLSYKSSIEDLSDTDQNIRIDLGFRS